MAHCSKQLAKGGLANPYQLISGSGCAEHRITGLLRVREQRLARVIQIPLQLIRHPIHFQGQRCLQRITVHAVHVDQFLELC